MKKGKMSTIRYMNNRKKDKIEWKETKAKMEKKLNNVSPPPRIRRKVEGEWIIIEKGNS
jgi:hypothetical protein